MDADPLPLYADGSEADLAAWVDKLAQDADRLGLPLEHMRYNRNLVWIKQHNVTVRVIWHKARSRSSDPAADDAAALLLLTQKRIIETFFRLVRLGRGDAVKLFVDKGLVSPDVTDGEGYDDGMGSQYPWPGLEDAGCDDDPWAGATPLLAAIDACRTDMVKLLLSLGADANRMARPPSLRALSGPQRRPGVDSRLQRRVRRTPLMLAAEFGNYAACKLLLLEHRADDALVAPDGQLALRLAAQARHRDIVELLPARRGGALQRMSATNARSMERIRGAGRRMAWLTKAVCWDAPAYVLYEFPLEAILKPAGRGLRYLWTHWPEVCAAVAEFLLHLPAHAWSAVRALGTALVETAKAVGRVVQRIPVALRSMGAWAVRALAAVGGALASIVERTASAIHTALVAIGSFFRHVTVQNVLDGFAAALHAACIVLPAAVGRAAVSFFKYASAAVCYAAGGVGVVVYLLGLLLWNIAVFVPKSIWQIVRAIGSSIAHGATELRVLFNPKAI